MKGFSICSTLIFLTAITGDYVIIGYWGEGQGVCIRHRAFLEWANENVFKQIVLELKGICCYNSYLLSLFVWLVGWFFLFCFSLWFWFVWCFYRTDGCRAPNNSRFQWPLQPQLPCKEGPAAFCWGTTHSVKSVTLSELSH